MIIKLLLTGMCQVLHKLSPIYSSHKRLGRCRYDNSHFTNKETEAQSSWVICLRFYKLVSGKAYNLYLKDVSDASSLILETLLYLHYLNFIFTTACDVFYAKT